MKILQIHISDSERRGGGGGVAMNRLHAALQAHGIQSRLLCGSKTTDSADVRSIPSTRLDPLVRRISLRVGLNDVHRLGSFRVTSDPFYRESDLVHFHGTHSGAFSYLAFPKVTRERPAVFTLHDMWAMTGHCAYSFDCRRWKLGCGSCPHLETNPSVRTDGTHLEWKLKNWAYRKSNLTFVSPSSWLARQARESMLRHYPVKNIPNGIDTGVYQPLDKKICRAVLGIPPEKWVLMFCAMNVKDRRKGGDLLLAALQKLPPSMREETVVLLLGAQGQDMAASLDMPAVSLGYVSHDRLKALCYSAADLFLHPTRADNLPLVLQESMACGVPLVSFEVGGVPDLVRPNITGYLAKSEDVTDFSQGIQQLLEDRRLRERLSHQCRNIALQEYSMELYVDRHLELYRSLLAP